MTKETKQGIRKKVMRIKRLSALLARTAPIKRDHHVRVQYGLTETDICGTYLENASHYLCLKMSLIYVVELYNLDRRMKGRSPVDRR